MAITVSSLKRESAGSQIAITGTLAFDSSYPTGGESLSSALLGLSQVDSFLVESVYAGKLIEANVSSDKSSTTLKVYTGGAQTFTGTAPAAENVDVTDDDSAASNGVALFVHTKNGVDAWLEFVSPTNADGTGTCNNGGATYFVFDSDAAATDGVAVYFDEDGANADERFLVVSPSGQDLYLPIGSGKAIRLKHDASAASNGVQVYFDEDASNSYDRLLFVSPTNADGTGSTDDLIFGRPGVPAGTNATADVSEVSNGSNLSSLSAVEFRALGR